IFSIIYGYLFLVLFHVQFGHYSNGVRDVPKQEHFHGNTNEAMKNTSVKLYYKILDELFKRPALLVATASKFGKEFDNFVLDFVQASYIGLFTPDDVYFGKIMPIYFPQAKISVDHQQEKCEIAPAEVETKICARDMESMLDYVHRVFGSDSEFKAVETKHSMISAPLLQDYIVLEDPQEIKGPGIVICHPMYEDFFCHYDADATKVLKVSLGGNNGDKVEAIGICHMDTSGLSHDHIAFRLLPIKLGSPLCHFLAAGHLVWVQSAAVSQGLLIN
ncbi:hypothetical protein MANES_07G053754v8, partial [Manihot esculenta]